MLWILTGPAGAGKKTLQRILCRRYPDLFTAVVPYTSRTPRPHEQHNAEYCFVTPALFQQYATTPRFFTEVYTKEGHRYGLNLTQYRDPTKITLCVLTPAGCERARKMYPTSYIFGITAPLQSLLQRLATPRSQQLSRDQRYLEQAHITRIVNADGQSNTACDCIMSHFCRCFLPA
jgi:guanylate kinase